MHVSQDASLRPSMDIFAVGCVVAELFLEGQPLFEQSQLLAYRRGQYDPSQHLEKIPDSGLCKMILHMIQLDPDSRCSAESYLQSYTGVVFPCYFSLFLHKFYSLLNPHNSDSRVLICQLSFHETLEQMMRNKAGEEMDLTSNAFQSSEHIDAKQSIDLPKDPLEDMEKGSIHGRFELPGDISSLLRDVKQNNRQFGCNASSGGCCQFCMFAKPRTVWLASSWRSTPNYLQCFQEKSPLFPLKNHNE